MNLTSLSGFCRLTTSYFFVISKLSFSISRVFADFFSNDNNKIFRAIKIVNFNFNFTSFSGFSVKCQDDVISWNKKSSFSISRIFKIFVKSHLLTIFLHSSTTWRWNTLSVNHHQTLKLLLQSHALVFKHGLQQQCQPPRKQLLLMAGRRAVQHRV